MLAAQARIDLRFFSDHLLRRSLPGRREKW